MHAKNYQVVFKLRCPSVRLLTFAFLVGCLLHATFAARLEAVDGYPAAVTEVKFRSALDGSLQPALFFAPPADRPVPLLVALHTWSGGYRQDYNTGLAQGCIERGWVFIQPHFRGPNRNPDACGSDLAVADVEDAVTFAKRSARIDPSRVYLAGASGGGHMALLMAGRAPELWAGVSAWVPISDLSAWYHECRAAGRKYANDLVASCGGAPGTNPAIDHEYQRRSPLTWLGHAARANVPIDINTGIRDGHDGSVPVSHSLRAFNVLAAASDRLTLEEIAHFTQKAEVPEALRGLVSDGSYGEKPPLFRRSSGSARVTVFQGGHEMVASAALSWLEARNRRPTQRPEDLRVLEEHSHDLLFEHLLQASVALDTKRQRRLQQALVSRDSVVVLQKRLRDAYRELLGPFPERTPLNAQVTGRLEGAGVRIEKVLFESFRGHHVTALLYLPTQGAGPWPGVLFACGHASNGKAFPNYQRTCALLARSGFAVLSYDPISQGERLQLPESTRHGSTTHTLLNVGAQLVGRSVAWYEAWDGIRALDYLASRPEVDRSRPFGMTGTSGGGTQTTFLMAVDERIGPAAPSCYIMRRSDKFRSDHGPADGCQHLPGEGLHGLDLIDYAILRAPKPTAVLAATRDFFPIESTRRAVQEATAVYDTLGASRSLGFFEAEAEHGMHQEHRQEATRWMREWLLGDAAPVVEPDGLEVFPDEEVRVTRSGQVVKEFEGEVSVVQLTLRQARELEPRRAEFSRLGLQARRAKIRGLLGVDEERRTPRVERFGRGAQRDGYSIDKLTLRRPGEVPIPALLFVPQEEETAPAGGVVWVDGRGKEAEARGGGQIEKLVRAGNVVLAIDVRGVGETLPRVPDRKYRNRAHCVATVAAHIGRPLLGGRVEDVLAAVDVLVARAGVGSGGVRLVGLGTAGPVVLHAAVLYGDGPAATGLEVQLSAVEVRGAIASWIDDVIARPLGKDLAQHVVPGALRYYDLPDLVNVLGARYRRGP